jgi:hypothetical protein
MVYGDTLGKQEYGIQLRARQSRTTAAGDVLGGEKEHGGPAMRSASRSMAVGNALNELLLVRRGE